MRAPVSRRERRGERRVIPVRVSREDPADRAAGSGEDAAQVVRLVGPGIEHRDLGIAEQVGVRPGSGHESGVAGDDAPYTGRHDDGGPYGEIGGNHDGSYFIKFFDPQARGGSAVRVFCGKSSRVGELDPILT